VRTATTTDASKRYVVSTAYAQKENVVSKSKARLMSEKWVNRYLDVGDCWLYKGTVDVEGYTHIRSTTGHRAIYEHLVGPIPAGMTLDHACRVRHCLNPDHMRVMSIGDNMKSSPKYWATRSKRDWSATHCRNGHEWADGNQYVAASGDRYCRACSRDSKRREGSWQGGEGHDWRKGKAGGWR